MHVWNSHLVLLYYAMLLMGSECMVVWFGSETVIIQFVNVTTFRPEVRLRVQWNPTRSSTFANTIIFFNPLCRIQ